MRIQHLTVEEVCLIHDALARDFSDSDDPVSPPGVRDHGLLESAISRQATGFDGRLKYDTPELSAATLTYGICSNHAFHNGNKRAAVVALLVHLDKNDRVLSATHDELLRMIIALSQHRFADTMLRNADKRRLLARNTSDMEVSALALWIRRRSKKLDRRERQVTYRELRRILRRFNYELEVPHGNCAHVVSFVEKRNWVGVRKRERVVHASIGYRNEGTPVCIKDIKDIRAKCNLTPDHGVDSRHFYDNEASIDAFVVQYRSLLRRLARR